MHQNAQFSGKNLKIFLGRGHNPSPDTTPSAPAAPRCRVFVAYLARMLWHLASTPSKCFSQFLPWVYCVFGHHMARYNLAMPAIASDVTVTWSVRPSVRLPQSCILLKLLTGMRCYLTSVAPSTVTSCY